MALFGKDKKNGESVPAQVSNKKEIRMADPLKEAITDTKEATEDFIAQLDKFADELESGAIEKGTKILKKVRRASMTLTDELIDLRKHLP